MPSGLLQIASSCVAGSRTAETPRGRGKERSPAQTSPGCRTSSRPTGLSRHPGRPSTNCNCSQNVAQESSCQEFAERISGDFGPDSQEGKQPVRRNSCPPEEAEKFPPACRES